MNKLSSKKYLFITRHGQRSDFIGITPKFGILDPEITLIGQKQSLLMGKLISKQLAKMNVLANKVNIQIISSPFIRTLQTSKYIINGILSENKYNISNTIYVDYHLCEFINCDYKKNFPKNFLNIIKNTPQFQDEFKNVNIQILNDDIDILPSKEEDNNMLSERIKNFLFDKLEEIHRQDIFNVFIFVTHQEPIDCFNKLLGYTGQMGWYYIDYCDTYIYDITIKNNIQEIKKLTLKEYNSK